MDPLEVTFDVACQPDRAFALWTERIDTWWPAGKSFSADPAVTVTFDAKPGGRIYETTPAGDQHDWGRVLDVDQPNRVRFTWHLMFDAAEATEVEVTFRPTDGGTRITLVHGGWDQLDQRLGGGIAQQRRDRNRAGWTAIADVFTMAASA